MPRYLVIRCPTTGPPALIAPPNDFATREEAEARIAALEVRQAMTHHTHLEVMVYDGNRSTALAAAGVLE